MAYRAACAVALLALILAAAVADVNATGKPIPRTKLTHRKHVQSKVVQKILAGEPLYQIPSKLNKLGALPISYMRNIGDGEYAANITIGTPPQQFSLIMDTGSGNIWAPGTKCRDAGCSLMNKFNADASSTYVATGQPFILIYGTGSCLGELANETIAPSVGGPGIVNQTWGYATEVAKFFEQVPDCDGIWGLGLPMVQEPPTLTTPIDNMYSQGIIPNHLFSVYLDSGMGDDSSEIIWGTVDNTKYTGELITAKYQEYPPTEYTYYMMGWTEMTINGNKVAGEGCSELLPCLAVVDTGTSVVLGPQNTVNAINNALNIAADCSNFGQLPNVEITIGSGKKLSIPSTVYIIKDPVAGNCTSGFYGTPVYQGFWIFGDPFLRAVYTVFDNDNKKFSFGQSVGPSNIRV